MATKVRQVLSPLVKNQDSTYHFVNLNAFVDLSSITLKIHFRSQKPYVSSFQQHLIIYAYQLTIANLSVNL